MYDKYSLDEILGEQYYNNLIKRKYRSNNYDECLTDSDFYPPSDYRVLKSYIDDIDGGDNFADFCEYIFDLYEEEGYWD